VKECGDEIVFLHRIEDGGTDKSYGLHVGRLAGLPKDVLERAKIILDKLEDEGEKVKDSLEQTKEMSRSEKKQLSLFESPKDLVIKELSKIRSEDLTPLEALQKISEWESLM